MKITTTQVDDGTLERLASIDPRVNRAIRRSIDLTSRSVATKAVKKAAGDIGIKQKSLKDKRLFVRKASGLSGGMWLGLSEVRAIDLKGAAKQTPTGVKKGSHFYKGAFLATMPGGHTGIFRRAETLSRWTAGRPNKYDPNLPIKEVKELFGDISGYDEFTGEARAIFEKKLQQQLNYEFNVK